MTVRKSKTYSWRVASDLKAELADQACAEGISLAALLERIVREWLRGHEREQAQIKAAAMRAIGTLRGDDPDRANRLGTGSVRASRARVPTGRDLRVPSMPILGMASGRRRFRALCGR